MEVSGMGANVGALRQYKAAQKALAPDKNADGDLKLSGAENAGTSGIAGGLAKGVEDFSAVFQNVENTVQAHAVGQADAHSVVEAMANAELALETAVTIRNRVVEAYQELLRMPV